MSGHHTSVSGHDTSVSGHDTFVSGHGLLNSAVFVMYNCARLATLFQHFNEAVHKGFFTQLVQLLRITNPSLMSCRSAT